MEMENQILPIGIDLGASQDLFINLDMVALNKQPHGTERWMDVQGGKHCSPYYTLKQVKLQSLIFNKAKVIGKQSNDLPILWSNLSKEEKASFPISNGSMGRGLLVKKNWLFDLSKSIIIASNSHKKLKSDGYDLATFIKVPIVVSGNGVELEINTDIGKLNLVLDTGASYTLIRDTILPTEQCKSIKHGFPMLTSQKFIIGGYNFGDQNLHFFSISDDPKLSHLVGLLGMDFFKAHILYLDFQNSTLYIKRGKA